ncbi:hypothetical protein V1477_005728 [Vespula maculifrons]|uniref:Uncharacterized protein n=1 Tax=Vespula maculifrons TaxID=7453 RepID=A0ABD2CM47_VESMC
MVVCGRNSSAEVILSIIFEERYTRLNEDKSNSNGFEVLQRIKIERYLESTSKKDIWISTKLNMIIKHLTSKMKRSSCFSGTSCFSSNPTIRSTWIYNVEYKICIIEILSSRQEYFY